MTDRLTPDDPALLASVRLGESLRLHAYPDPLSHGAPWTIGYGHTSPRVCEGLACTEAEAEAWLRADLAGAMHALDESEPWWRTLSPNRQRVLAEMTFNLGPTRTLQFHAMLLALQTRRWDEAADQMLDSLWARQVGERAQRLADAMRAG